MIKPQEVSDVDLAFPADVSALMPKYDEIPEEFKDGSSKWVDFQKQWFFDGLPKESEFDLVDGIDGRMALRHLRAIQGSFQPKHEHKEAAVAYLASLWFTKVVAGDKKYP